VAGTTLKYALARPGQASLRILDPQGRTIRQIQNMPAQQGLNTQYVDLSMLPCGLYTYVLETTQGTLASQLSIAN